MSSSPRGFWDDEIEDINIIKNQSGDFKNNARSHEYSHKHSDPFHTSPRASHSNSRRDQSSSSRHIDAVKAQLRLDIPPITSKLPSSKGNSHRKHSASSSVGSKSKNDSSKTKSQSSSKHHSKRSTHASSSNSPQTTQRSKSPAKNVYHENTNKATSKKYEADNDRGSAGRKVPLKITIQKPFNPPENIRRSNGPKPGTVSVDADTQTSPNSVHLLDLECDVCMPTSGLAPVIIPQYSHIIDMDNDSDPYEDEYVRSVLTPVTEVHETRSNSSCTMSPAVSQELANFAQYGASQVSMYVKNTLHKQSPNHYSDACHMCHPDHQRGKPSPQNSTSGYSHTLAQHERDSISISSNQKEQRCEKVARQMSITNHSPNGSSSNNNDRNAHATNNTKSNDVSHSCKRGSLDSCSCARCNETTSSRRIDSRDKHDFSHESLLKPTSNKYDRSNTLLTARTGSFDMRSQSQATGRGSLATYRSRSFDCHSQPGKPTPENTHEVKGHKDEVKRRNKLSTLHPGDTMMSKSFDDSASNDRGHGSQGQGKTDRAGRQKQYKDGLAYSKSIGSCGDQIHHKNAISRPRGNSEHGVLGTELRAIGTEFWETTGSKNKLTKDLRAKSFDIDSERKGQRDEDPLHAWGSNPQRHVEQYQVERGNSNRSKERHLDPFFVNEDVSNDDDDDVRYQSRSTDQKPKRGRDFALISKSFDERVCSKDVSRNQRNSDRGNGKTTDVMSQTAKVRDVSPRRSLNETMLQTNTELYDVEDSRKSVSNTTGSNTRQEMCNCDSKGNSMSTKETEGKRRSPNLRHCHSFDPGDKTDSTHSINQRGHTPPVRNTIFALGSSFDERILFTNDIPIVNTAHKNSKHNNEFLRRSFDERFSLTDENAFVNTSLKNTKQRNENFRNRNRSFDERFLSTNDNSIEDSFFKCTKQQNEGFKTRKSSFDDRLLLKNDISNDNNSSYNTNQKKGDLRIRNRSFDDRLFYNCNTLSPHSYDNNGLDQRHQHVRSCSLEDNRENASDRKGRFDETTSTFPVESRSFDDRLSNRNDVNDSDKVHCREKPLNIYQSRSCEGRINAKDDPSQIKESFVMGPSLNGRNSIHDRNNKNNFSYQDSVSNRIYLNPGSTLRSKEWFQSSKHCHDTTHKNDPSNYKARSFDERISRVGQSYPDKKRSRSFVVNLTSGDYHNSSSFSSNDPSGSHESSSFDSELLYPGRIENKKFGSSELNRNVKKELGVRNIIAQSREQQNRHSLPIITTHCREQQVRHSLPSEIRPHGFDDYLSPQSCLTPNSVFGSGCSFHKGSLELSDRSTPFDVPGRRARSFDIYDAKTKENSESRDYLTRGHCLNSDSYLSTHRQSHPPSAMPLRSGSIDDTRLRACSHSGNSTPERPVQSRDRFNKQKLCKRQEAQDEVENYGSPKSECKNPRYSEIAGMNNSDLELCCSPICTCCGRVASAHKNASLDDMYENDNISGRRNAHMNVRSYSDDPRFLNVDKSDCLEDSQKTSRSWEYVSNSKQSWIYGSKTGSVDKLAYHYYNKPNENANMKNYKNNKLNVCWNRINRKSRSLDMKNPSNRHLHSGRESPLAVRSLDRDNSDLNRSFSSDGSSKSGSNSHRQLGSFEEHGHYRNQTNLEVENSPSPIIIISPCADELFKHSLFPDRAESRDYTTPPKEERKSYPQGKMVYEENQVLNMADGKRAQSSYEEIGFSEERVKSGARANSARGDNQRNMSASYEEETEKKSRLPDGYFAHALSSPCVSSSCSKDRKKGHRVRNRGADACKWKTITPLNGDFQGREIASECEAKSVRLKALRGSEKKDKKMNSASEPDDVLDSFDVGGEKIFRNRCKDRNVVHHHDFDDGDDKDDYNDNDDYDNDFDFDESNDDEDYDVDNDDDENQMENVGEEEKRMKKDYIKNDKNHCSPSTLKESQKRQHPVVSNVKLASSQEKNNHPSSECHSSPRSRRSSSPLSSSHKDISHSRQKEAKRRSWLCSENGASEGGRRRNDEEKIDSNCHPLCNCSDSFFAENLNQSRSYDSQNRKCGKGVNSKNNRKYDNQFDDYVDDMRNNRERTSLKTTSGNGKGSESSDSDGVDKNRNDDNNDDDTSDDDDDDDDDDNERNVRKNDNDNENDNNSDEIDENESDGEDTTACFPNHSMRWSDGLPQTLLHDFSLYASGDENNIGDRGTRFVRQQSEGIGRERGEQERIPARRGNGTGESREFVTEKTPTCVRASLHYSVQSKSFDGRAESARCFRSKKDTNHQPTDRFHRSFDISHYNPRDTSSEFLEGNPLLPLDKRCSRLSPEVKDNKRFSWCSSELVNRSSQHHSRPPCGGFRQLSLSLRDESCIHNSTSQHSAQFNHSNKHKGFQPIIAGHEQDVADFTQFCSERVCMNNGSRENLCDSKDSCDKKLTGNDNNNEAVSDPSTCESICVSSIRGRASSDIERRDIQYYKNNNNHHKDRNECDHNHDEDDDDDDDDDEEEDSYDNEGSSVVLVHQSGSFHSNRTGNDNNISQNDLQNGWKTNSFLTQPEPNINNSESNNGRYELAEGDYKTDSSLHIRNYLGQNGCLRSRSADTTLYAGVENESILLSDKQRPCSHSFDESTRFNNNEFCGSLNSKSCVSSDSSNVTCLQHQHTDTSTSSDSGHAAREKYTHIIRADIHIEATPLGNNSANEIGSFSSRDTVIYQPPNPVDPSPVDDCPSLSKETNKEEEEVDVEATPLLNQPMAGAVDGRGIEIIVSDENDARVSTVQTGKGAIFRRIWLVLLDNRMAGQPENAAAMRQQPEEYRLLKKTLNIVFIVVGVALLVSVFVVIAYTYAVDPDDRRDIPPRESKPEPVDTVKEPPPVIFGNITTMSNLL